MSIALKRWGLEVRVCEFCLNLTLGDFYVRVPMLFEIAWNSTGFYVDRTIR